MIDKYVKVHRPIGLNHFGQLNQKCVSSVVLSALVTHVHRLIGDHDLS